MTIVADKSGVNLLDNKYRSASRTAANLAGVIALTPAFAGEIVRALDTGFQYRATGPAAGAWELISESFR